MRWLQQEGQRHEEIAPGGHAERVGCALVENRLLLRHLVQVETMTKGGVVPLILVSINFILPRHCLLQLFHVLSILTHRCNICLFNFEIDLKL